MTFHHNKQRLEPLSCATSSTLNSSSPRSYFLVSFFCWQPDAPLQESSQNITSLWSLIMYDNNLISIHDIHMWWQTFSLCQTPVGCFRWGKLLRALLLVDWQWRENIFSIIFLAPLFFFSTVSTYVCRLRTPNKSAENMLQEKKEKCVSSTKHTHNFSIKIFPLRPFLLSSSSRSLFRVFLTLLTIQNLNDDDETEKKV